MEVAPSIGHSERASGVGLKASALHLLILWTLAVAQPLFDLLDDGLLGDADFLDDVVGPLAPAEAPARALSYESGP